MSKINKEFKDLASVIDYADVNKLNIPNKSVRGRVVVKDTAGNVLFEKDNTVVLRGRGFMLEKLFNTPFGETDTTDPYNPEKPPFTNNLNRSVMLFTCGNGGCPTGEPFNPIKPGYDDVKLLSPVPFKTVYTVDTGDSNGDLPEEEINTYYGKKVRLGQDSTTGHAEVDYFYKRFEGEGSWGIDRHNNEIFRKITLKIDENDFKTKRHGANDYYRDTFVNELGLVIAQYDKELNQMVDTELFSRITFDSESLASTSISGTTKTIIIDYYIYI